jgi:hypothetical protein
MNPGTILDPCFGATCSWRTAASDLDHNCLYVEKTKFGVYLPQLTVVGRCLILLEGSRRYASGMKLVVAASPVRNGAVT